ncbi:MAG: hypothetical protein U0936_21395 [Planctomycetaceae bacterium]
MTSMGIFKQAGCVISGLLLAVAVGCGGAVDSGPKVDATVTGKVTSDGKPVSNATISFEKAGFGAWGAPLGTDGGYTVELAAGDYVVTITPSMAPVTMTPGAMPKMDAREDIPKDYRTASTTKAKATVKAGPNTVDLALEK